MSTTEQKAQIAQEIWAVMREHEDRCDLEVEDVWPEHMLWAVTDIVVRRLSAENEALRLRLMTAERGTEDAAKAEAMYRDAECLLTADERSLNDEVLRLRAQVEALTKPDVTYLRNWSMLAARALDDCHGVIKEIEAESTSEQDSLTELRNRVSDLFRQALSLHGLLTRSQLNNRMQFGKLADLDTNPSPLTRPAVPDSVWIRQFLGKGGSLVRALYNDPKDEIDASATGDWIQTASQLLTSAASHQPRPAVPDADLVERCREIVIWRKTGILPGGALRQFAEAECAQFGDDSIQQAEIKTIKKALEWLAAAPQPEAQPTDHHANCPEPVDEIEAAEREHMGCAHCKTGIYAEAQPTEAAQPTQYLQKSDQQLLRRFIETSDDDQPFDIGVPAVKRLADLGVVRNCGFGKYAVTMFGYWVHEHFWHQNPPLPLMTNADRDAVQKAKLVAQKGGA